MRRLTIDIDGLPRLWMSLC